MERFIPYSRQLIDDDDIQAVVEVLKSDYITQGPKIREFEEKLSVYCGAKYAVAFNSGTSALHAAYFALGLSKGDEFLTTPITFVATANAGLYLGAKPIFVDVEPDTGNINPDILEKHITERTKLISVVHYAGHPVDMEKVKRVADAYGLKIVEDACHALGARYKGSKIGSCKYSDVTVFSFHPVKHITTGEGGAALTNDREIYRKLLMFRNHGVTKNRGDFVRKGEGDWYYEMHLLGFNYRITDIQAALGISQLCKLDWFVGRRREIAALYNKFFGSNSYFEIPVEKGYAHHSYHLYIIRLKDRYTHLRTALFRNLRQKGIGVQVHYIPLYWHPYYQKLGYGRGLSPMAEDFYRRVLSIPVYPSLEKKEVEYVALTLMDILKSLSDNR